MSARLAALGNTRTHNGRLTAELSAAVVPLYPMEREAVTVVIADFVAKNAAGFRNVISEAEGGPTTELNPLLVQPELPMICERLENDRVRLEEAWPYTVPREWLDDLAEKWGVGRPEQ